MMNPTSSRLQIGSGSSAVSFYGWTLPFKLDSQTTPGLRQGPEIQRVGRETVTPFRLDAFDRFIARSGVASWERDKTGVYYNEGLMHHVSGSPLLCLPYLTTAQSSLAAVDISGYRAANRRAHAIMSSLGSAAGSRFYSFLGPNMYKDTSTSNPALIPPATADNLTDNVTAAAEMIWGGAQALTVATDGATDDIRYTTDPTADSVTWTTAVAHSGTPWVSALASFQNLGSGYNIVVGNPAGTNGIWYAGQSETVPVTLKQVVTSATANKTNSSNSTLNTGARSATNFTEADGVNGGGTTSIGGISWTNPTNASASDDARATAAVGANSSKLFIASNFGFTVPTNADIVGVLVEVEKSENDLADNITDDFIYLVTGISAGDNSGTMTTNATVIGANKADTTTEWPVVASEAYLSYGGSADLWSVPSLSPAQANASGFGVGIQADGGDVAAIANIDHIRVTLYYRLKGSMPSIPTGGWSIGKDPANVNTLYLVAPTSNQLTTYTNPRELWKLEFDVDAESDRPIVTVSKPNTNLPHVEDVTYYQGGVAAAGGPMPGPGTAVKLVDSNGVTRDLGFPAVHGATAVRVISMHAASIALFCWVANNAADNNQLWIYFDGRWQAFGVLWSKVASISVMPIGFAERSFNLTQNFIYCFWPSSTNTAVSRQFVPIDNVFGDPFLVNTSQVKQDGPLYIQTLELDVMPEEAAKAVLALEMQSRRVDNNTAYGSVRVQVDTGGDHTFASAEVDQTFDAAAEVLTPRNLSAAGDPGVAYRTMITRITLDHEAGTAETPNGLPVLFSLSAQWTPLKSFAVVLDKTAQTEPPMALCNRLEALIETKVAQPFSGEGLTIPVVLDLSHGGYEFVYSRGTLGKVQPTWDSVEKALIYFKETAGAV